MKKVLLAILVLSIFIIPNVSAKAYSFEYGNKYNNTTKIDYLEDKGDYASCDGIFTSEGLEMIREVLGWIRIIGPALLVLLISVDLSSAVLSQDNDALQKATKKIVPRAIATALLFFVPTIVRAILGIDGVKDSIVIPDDPLCHSMRGQEVEIIYKDNI